jgi:hypothetical protein
MIGNSTMALVLAVRPVKRLWPSARLHKLHIELLLRLLLARLSGSLGPARHARPDPGHPAAHTKSEFFTDNEFPCSPKLVEQFTATSEMSPSCSRPD